jgi:REP element-mobilizing transposase RayT
MRASHPERLRGFDYVGYHRYFLTFCTFNRRPLFVDDDHVDIVLAQILRACGQEQFATLAYCFMPDHRHLLAESLQRLVTADR